MKYYSRKGCEYDCRVRFASEGTGCAPWDYPLPEDLQNVPICQSKPTGSLANPLAAFDKAMRSNASLGLANACQTVRRWNIRFR